MQQFKGTFTKIKEPISDHRRMPRLGRIRLGIKVKKMTPRGEVEYPKDVPYFVVPQDVEKVTGPQPTELDVMLPADDPEIIFPQKLALYGSSKGLKCQGNGQEASRYNEQTKEWESRSCPCEFRKTEDNPKGECTETAHLMVLLPKVSLGGVFQITTGSYNSIVDVNSGLDFIRGMVGRIALVPLKLRREKRETHHDGKKQTHYTLSLTLDANIDGINRLREDTKRIMSNARYQIEGPVEENPKVAPPDVVLKEDEEDEIEDAQVVTGNWQPAASAPAPPVAAAPIQQDMTHQQADLHGLSHDLIQRIRMATSIEAVNTELEEANVYPFSSGQMQSIKKEAAERVAELKKKK